MEKKQIAHFKEKLVAELKTLEEELESTGRKNPEHPNDWEAKPDDMDILSADENEVADQLESLQENQAALGSLEGRFNQVKKALARTENNTFGICKICGKVIESERLEANPAAETCIEHRDKE